MTIPLFEIELSPIPFGAVHELGHGDMTTIDRVTSMKEEEVLPVSVIEPLSVSDEVVVVID
jgi:hypothetical protein